MSAVPVHQPAGQEPEIWSGKALHIIECAEQLFAGHGFAGASVRDIAQAAGVNVAMISYYFGSKEKLLEAIFYHRVSSNRILLEGLIEDKTYTPLEKFDLLTDRYAEKLISCTPFQQIMMREQLSKDMDWFQELTTNMKMSNRKLVEEIIAQGQRQKQFRKNIEAPLLMATLMGTLYQLLATPAYMRKVLKAENLSDLEYRELLIQKAKAHLRVIAHALLLPS